MRRVALLLSALGLAALLAGCSQQMAQRLRSAGVPVALHVYPHASHTTLIGAFAWPLRWVAPVLDDVAAFIDATAPVR